MSSLKRDQHFARQVLDFDFRYRCQDCSFVKLPELTCTMDFPNQMLLEPRIHSLEEDGAFVFCKYFELEDLA